MACTSAPSLFVPALRITNGGARPRRRSIGTRRGELSDNGPITVAVDIVAAYGSNEYSDGVEADGRRVRTVMSDEHPGEWYQHERLGTLADGTHVLKTAECGGGSGVFMELLFVRLKPEEAYRPDGKPYGRLLMTVVRWYPLGDRDDGEVQVRQNRVIVGRSGHRTRPVVLTF